MHEIKTMTIYFYNSFYNGYCLCHVPCVNFFLLFNFFFTYERIFYLQETIYRIVYSKRKHQNELRRIASLCTCTRCVPISDRHTKRATYLVTLQNELNSDVARFTTHEKTLQPYLLQARAHSCCKTASYVGGKNATSLYSSFCRNVAKQVARFTLRLFLIVHNLWRICSFITCCICIYRHVHTIRKRNRV